MKIFYFSLSFIILISLAAGIKYSSFPEAKNIQSKVEGFVVESILTGEGEYLSITPDPQGRLIISPRFGKVIRVTIDGERAVVDTMELGVTDCQGMLYAYDHLYMMGSGPNKLRGVHRVPDLSGLGDYGPVELLKEFPKNGDHSGHTIAKGADGQLYFLSGNVNKVPTGPDVQYINDDWHDDHPMMLNSIYGGDQKAPGGFVMRTDPEGNEWTLYAMGLRNPYDMCFNAEGELFTYDSDMEWDFNLPWYRPTRVNHLVSGADFAWRPYNGKRFDYYPDIWSSVLDFGRGSPTSTCFGTGTNFPDKYQKALFLGDWSYGKIFALHLEEDGSSYRGVEEIFATGKPLNITDMVVGKDGSLYFVTGGNGTDTGLFRIRWTGESNDPVITSESNLRNLRHQIEEYHSASDGEGIDLAIANIDHDDEFIRKSARIILERNKVKSWFKKIKSLEKPNGQLNVLTALIRADEVAEYSSQIMDLFEHMNMANLNHHQKAGFARLVSLWRLRNPDIESKPMAILQHILTPLFPSSDPMLNKELTRSLATIAIALKDDAGLIRKTMKEIESTDDSKMIIHYLEMLRHVEYGWTDQDRLAYLYWADYAIQNWSGGSLFNFFVKQIKTDFESQLSKDELLSLEHKGPKMISKEYSGPFNQSGAKRVANTSTNTYVQNWTFEDLEYSLELVNSPRGNRERNLHRGYQMLEKGLCYNCHYIINRGGSFGPELTLASNSFGIEELLRTTIYPSEAINARFQSTEFQLKENGFARGRIINESESHFVIQSDWTGKSIEEIPKDAVLSQEPSKISDMPPALVNSMQRNDILDMLYFISEIPGKMENKVDFDILEGNTYNEYGDSTLVELINYSQIGKLYFQVDNAEFELYKGPFYLNQTTNITAYKSIDGEKSEQKSRLIHFYDPEINGLNFELYNDVDQRFSISNQVPDDTGMMRSFDISQIIQDKDNFEIHLEGFIKIETPGEYFFHATFNDALKMYIDGDLIINRPDLNWGGTGSRCTKLDKGMVPISIKLYDRIGMEYLKIEYEGPNISRQVIPSNLIYLND